jgi:hypothetical protein
MSDINIPECSKIENTSSKHNPCEELLAKVKANLVLASVIYGPSNKRPDTSKILEWLTAKRNTLNILISDSNILK